MDVVMRSSKSSSVAQEKASQMRVIDVSRTVRRRLDMSSIPDVVQTSQPSKVESEESSSSGDSEHEDDQQFFLAKNSKLFSQVSSNDFTLDRGGEMQSAATVCPSDSSFHIVEVREREITRPKVSSSEDGYVLPSANVRVQQTPQVVERVEIVEDTETEPESAADTDSEDKIGAKNLIKRQNDRAKGDVALELRARRIKGRLALEYMFFF